MVKLFRLKPAKNLMNAQQLGYVWLQNKGT